MPATTTDDLARWLSRIALGDRQAFERLYRATSGTLLTVAYRVLNHRDRAEEVLQEAFVNVWHAAASYNASVSTPMTWLINIVRNKAIDAYRSRAGERERTVTLDEPEELDAHASAAPGPQQWLEDGLKAAGIQACMGSLSPAQRQALALAYYRGLVHAEIAEVLGTPLGTAKAWVRRGLDALRRCLEARGITEA
jgi:RNA polymerase sigma-70 factor (ECF subfamily)